MFYVVHYAIMFLLFNSSAHFKEFCKQFERE